MNQRTLIGHDYRTNLDTTDDPSPAMLRLQGFVVGVIVVGLFTVAIVWGSLG